MERALYVCVAAVIYAAGCTLLAPSDADLTGGGGGAGGGSADGAVPDGPLRDGAGPVDSPPDTYVACNQAAQCGGGVCCASFDPGGNLVSVACASNPNACTPCCGGNGSVEILCDPNASAPCPPGRACKGTSRISGDSFCR